MSKGKVSSAAALGFVGVLLIGLCYRQFGGETEEDEADRRMQKEYAILKRRTEEFDWGSGLEDEVSSNGTGSKGNTFRGDRASPMFEEMRPKQLLPYERFE